MPDTGKRRQPPTGDDNDDAGLVDSLYRISRLVSETDDTHQALSIVVDELFKRLQPASASVALINPDTRLLEIEVQRGLPDHANTMELPLGKGVTGRVAQNGKPVIVHDVLAEPNYISVKETIRAEMAAPMIVRTYLRGGITESIVGVVNVDSETPGAFNEQDLKLLTVLTNEATRVVARLWHIRQLRQTSGQLETLINAGQRLARLRDEAGILKSIAEDARRMTACALSAVFLVTPDRGKLRSAYLDGLATDVSVEEHTLGESVIGVALRRHKQVSVYDLPKTEEHHLVRIVQENKLRSMLSTPIICDDIAIGVLNIYTHQPRSFSNDERSILRSLSSLGAVAIQNVRLYKRAFSTEDALRKNDRLTTLGTIAAEIAHEIRNPLTVIKLLFDSLDLDFDDADPRSQDVSVITEKINQLEEIVGRVLDFGRSRTGLHARFELCTLVDETLRLVRLKLDQSGIELVYHRPENPLQVEVHKGQLQQVILNLVLNAVHAMASGGQLTIRIEPDSAKRAVFNIHDTGCGVPEHLRHRIFESFLSGRPEGSGLGLAISRQILKAHRGRIELVHTSTEGSHFRFELPIVSAATPAPLPGAQAQ